MAETEPSRVVYENDVKHIKRYFDVFRKPSVVLKTEGFSFRKLAKIKANGSKLNNAYDSYYRNSNKKSD